jgi:hypothetical protein
VRAKSSKTIFAALSCTGETWLSERNLHRSIANRTANHRIPWAVDAKFSRWLNDSSPREAAAHCTCPHFFFLAIVRRGANERLPLIFQFLCRARATSRVDSIRLPRCRRGGDGGPGRKIPPSHLPGVREFERRPRCCAVLASLSCSRDDHSRMMGIHLYGRSTCLILRMDNLQVGTRSLP